MRFRSFATWRGRHGLAILAAMAAFAAPTLVHAQSEAPGEPVVIPGVEISGWGQATEVHGQFGRPAGSGGELPVVLILHGSGWIDGRGAFYTNGCDADAHPSGDARRL